MKDDYQIPLNSTYLGVIHTAQKAVYHLYSAYQYQVKIQDPKSSEDAREGMRMRLNKTLDSVVAKYPLPPLAGLNLTYDETIWPPDKPELYGVSARLTLSTGQEYLPVWIHFDRSLLKCTEMIVDGKDFNLFRIRWSDENQGT